MKDIELRDYFAAKAMAGVLANSTTFQGHDEISVAAYQMADAMLKARKVKADD